MAITAAERRALQVTYQIKQVRDAISMQKPEIVALIARGERVIDIALDIHNQKWFGGLYYIEVFGAKENIGSEVRTLLTKLYKAAGYDIRWGDPANATGNAIRIEYLREE